MNITNVRSTVHFETSCFKLRHSDSFQTRLISYRTTVPAGAQTRAPAVGKILARETRVCNGSAQPAGAPDRTPVDQQILARNAFAHNG